MNDYPTSDTGFENLAEQPSKGKLWARLGAGLATIALIAALSFGGFSLLYAGKIFPGVMANGAYLGGLTQAQAVAAIQKQAKSYEGELIPIAYNDTTLRINPSRFGLDYDAEAAAKEAYAYGRTGSILERLKVQIGAMTDQEETLAKFKYDQGKLYPYIRQIDSEVAAPVVNAGLNFREGAAFVEPAQPGRRLDIGRLTQMLEAHLASGSTDTIEAPVYEVAPLISTESVRKIASQADGYLSGPISLELPSGTRNLGPDKIVQWISVTRSSPRDFAVTRNISDLVAAPASVELSLNKEAVREYVRQMAREVDREPIDAALAIEDGRATVFRASREGYKLDQDQAFSEITQALEKDKADRAIKVSVAVQKPAVTQENLSELGINELISEGVSYFPGSAPARITNVRVGSVKYNGILIKPGETFSFNRYLGNVGPEEGYQPAIVILANKQEKQYGGGLCQVSSTLYRAALNAGLPITERRNHSYAVSYYTNPYPAPGVDATIYSPQLDLKFVNDTPNHILIQRVLHGTTLKFQFYSTKTKSGNIRGPFFVSGSHDATKASRTVFYRDVLDLNGNVMKTDTVYTNYKPSTDFPTTTQYN